MFFSLKPFQSIHSGKVLVVLVGLCGMACPALFASTDQATSPSSAAVPADQADAQTSPPPEAVDPQRASEIKTEMAQIVDRMTKVLKQTEEQEEQDGAADPKLIAELKALNDRYDELAWELAMGGLADQPAATNLSEQTLSSPSAAEEQTSDSELTH
jgi:hypothetical protein